MSARAAILDRCAAGICLFASCGPGTASVARAPSINPSSERVRAIASQGSAIAGRVLLDGKPVGYYSVTVTKSYAATILERATLVHAADGRFHVAVKEPGSWDVIIAGPGFARRVVAGSQVDEGKTSDLGDVVVTRGHTIRGVVRDTDGNPIVGADVALVTTELPDARGELDQLAHGNLFARSDDRGAYEIAGSAMIPLQMGHPQISATTRDHRVSLPAVVPDGDATIDLIVERTGRLEITLTGSVQTLVFVSPVGNRRVSLPVRTTNGMYHLDVPAGDYELSTIRPAQPYASQRQQVLVAAGAVAAVTIAVPPTPPVSIKVHVVGASCDEVQLFARDDAPAVTAKCNGGDAEFAQVEPGMYFACATGSSKRACEAFIVAEATANQNFEIHPRP
jgi:hypothetical protein